MLDEYDNNIIFGHCNFSELGKKIDKRHYEITQTLLSDEKLNCKSVLILIFMCGIGRSFVLGMQQEPPNTYRITLSDEELDIFIKSTHYDILSLWKYARSFNRFLDKYPESSTFLSFLDLYSIYLHHQHSFTLTDDVFDMIFLNEFIGYGNKLRVKARNKIDTHVARFESILTTVHRRYTEGSIPIYFPENHPSTHRLIEGFRIPIWVLPNNLKQADASLLSLYMPFSEMVAYWIWQMTSPLSERINNLPIDILYIYFDFDDVSKWLTFAFFINI